MERQLPTYQKPEEAIYREELEQHINEQKNRQSSIRIANGFSKYASRQELTRFIARVELFKKISHIRGSIAELGVNSGQGLMSWAHISSIFEPVGGMFRHIYGFDTFEGFPSTHEKDEIQNSKFQWKPNDLRDESFEDLLKCIELFDKNRTLGQIPKITLIKGDFNDTAEKFIKDNQHVLFSLLYLDFDLYEPTQTALEFFLPRCCKGSIIAFDEINHPLWPGETLALLEKMDIKHSSIQCFDYEPNMSFIQLGE